MSQNLIAVNIIERCPPGSLPIVQYLIMKWKEVSKFKEENIRKLEKLDWDKYWRYLVKPHRQWLMLHCLINTSSYMLPPLSDAVFTGQLCIRPVQPPEFRPMFNILQLKE